MCDRCLALQGGRCPPHLDYRNITESAVWPLTGISHDTYMRLDTTSLSPWKNMPGFHFHTISYDWMHNCYLGTGRDLCASAIKVLIDYCGFGGGSDSGSMDAVLADVHQRMRDVCAQYKFPDLANIQSFQLLMFLVLLVWGLYIFSNSQGSVCLPSRNSLLQI